MVIVSLLLVSSGYHSGACITAYKDTWIGKGFEEAKAYQLFEVPGESIYALWWKQARFRQKLRGEGEEGRGGGGMSIS